MLNATASNGTCSQPWHVQHNSTMHSAQHAGHKNLPMLPKLHQVLTLCATPKHILLTRANTAGMHSQACKHAKPTSLPPGNMAASASRKVATSKVAAEHSQLSCRRVELHSLDADAGAAQQQRADLHVVLHRVPHALSPQSALLAAAVCLHKRQDGIIEVSGQTLELPYIMNHTAVQPARPPAAIPCIIA